MGHVFDQIRSMPLSNHKTYPIERPGVVVMLVRLACVLALGVFVLPGIARAGCAEDVSRLMSKDTERLLSQYNRVTRRIEREGPTANLRAEECRIARQLEPQLANQVAAMKDRSAAGTRASPTWSPTSYRATRTISPLCAR
jgi:hypothetical protein